METLFKRIIVQDCRLRRLPRSSYKTQQHHNNQNFNHIERTITISVYPLCCSAAWPTVIISSFSCRNDAKLGNWNHTLSLNNIRGNLWRASCIKPGHECAVVNHFLPKFFLSYDSQKQYRIKSPVSKSRSCFGFYINFIDIIIRHQIPHAS